MNVVELMRVVLHEGKGVSCSLAIVEVKLHTSWPALEPSLLFSIEFIGEVAEQLFNIVNSRSFGDVRNYNRSFEEKLSILDKIASDDSSFNEIDNFSGEDLWDTTTFLERDICNRG